MISKTLLATIFVACCCTLEALADAGQSSPQTDINADINSIDINNIQAVRRKFHQFKVLFHKHYATRAAQRYRFRIFRKNLAEIQKMNANTDDTATYGLNQFSDLREDEVPRGFIPSSS